MDLRLKRQKVEKKQEEPLKKYSVLLSDMLGSGNQGPGFDSARGLDDTDLIYAWKDAWMGNREYEFTNIVPS